MTDTIEADVDVAPKALSNEEIMRQREAAVSIPTEPGDSTVGDVVAHPSQSSPGFNSMAEKLDKLMKEVNLKERQPDKSPALEEKTPEKPAAKPTEKKAETAEPVKSAEPAVEEKTITSAKAADWKAIKEKAKTWETKAQELEQKNALLAKEYEEFRKKAVEMGELEETKKTAAKIKAERDAFENQLKDIAVERSPEFKNFYDAKFTSAVALAKDAVGEAHAEKIESLLQMPANKWRKEQINAIREELAGVDQGQLDIAIADYDRTRKEREAALKDSQGSYQKLVGMQAERQNREKQLREQQLLAHTASVLAMAKDKFESFKPSDKEEHNQFVKANEERVRRYFMGQLEGEDLFMLPIKASEYDRLSRIVIPEMEKKMAELQATVDQYHKSQPSPAGGKAPANAQPAQGGDFIAKFNALWPAGNR